MQMLQNRTARSQLPMSHTARKQLGLSSDQLRVRNKNAHLSLHDLHVGQDAVFQDSTSKKQFPATTTSLCDGFQQPLPLYAMLQDSHKRWCYL